MLELATVLVQRWTLVVGIPLLGALSALVLTLVVPRTYSAETSFVPESDDQLRGIQGLLGLAGQFGVNLGNLRSQPTESPQFYAQLLDSRELLTRTITARYQVPGTAADSATLLDLLEVRGRDEAARLHKGLKKLRSRLRLRVDNATNLVRVTVDARHPQLAAAIANRLTEYVNEFNLQHRQTHAKQRRAFVERRVTEAGRLLREAEEALEAWLRSNRRWESSPELRFENQRLQRRIDLRQEVYVSLNRDLETASIEEVNDTPLITVIDPAISPRRPSKPNRLLWTVLGLMAGGIGGVGFAFGREYWDNARTQQPREYRELVTAVDRARRTLGRLKRQKHAGH
jgi:uncharacterized protein involved in exopolysaccharide biosynthesis